MIVRLANIDDLENLVEHDLRHFKENGYNNLPAHPFSKDHPFEKQKMMDQKKKEWLTKTGEFGWGRSFLLIVNNQILGHLNLKNQLPSCPHRTSLGMGIEESMRNRGAGKLLLKTAITWSQEQDFLDWIDITVFDHNLPAKKLYASFGFKELYTIPDLFRMNGLSIDDVRMTLKLK